jgi:uncharacterized protein
MKWREGKTGAAITVKVTTRASKNEVTEVLPEGTIKIRIKAAPVDGKANDMLLRFLADILHVPPSNLDVIAGQTGRDKLISITGIDPAKVTELIIGEIKS